MFDSLTPEQTRVLGAALEAVLQRLDPDGGLTVDYATAVDEPAGQRPRCR